MDTVHSDWPPLDYAAGSPTWTTLHRWTQMAGKFRLAQCPWTNHGWHVALHAAARGLSTSPIPYRGRHFQLDFDLVEHRLLIQASDGAVRSVALKARSVADFYREVMAKLAEMQIVIGISTTPCELADAIPFELDELPRAYDPEQASRWWRALAQADRVFKRFRARFVGKCSPVHFFWGGFDHAVTRFSGRPAPLHPGGIPHLADWITREAYSHEVSSAGFWSGGEAAPAALFYSYAYPEPPGFSDQALAVPGARYDASLREFVLPYDDVRQASSPDGLLLDFLESSYASAARLGHWDRAALEVKQAPDAASAAS